MGKIYNRKGKLAGYLRDNVVYSRHDEIIGYVQDNMFLDVNFNPIAFTSDNAIYTMSGMPWAYVDGRVIRDMSGNRIGSVNKNWPELLAAGSILGLGIGMDPVRYAPNSYNTGVYGTQGGLRGSIFGGLGAIGSSVNRFLFGGPMPMGYGVGPYYQERYGHHRHRHHNHMYNNDRYNYVYPNRKDQRYEQMVYGNRWYRNPQYGPVRYEGPEEYYEQNNYKSDRHDSDSYRQNGSGSTASGLGRMFLNNIGPIASAIGKYMFNGSNLSNLANIANMVNSAGLGGIGNAAGSASAAGFENMGPLFAAMASMFGGTGTAAGTTTPSPAAAE